jgi:cell division protein FtsB
MTAATHAAARPHVRTTPRAVVLVAIVVAMLVYGVVPLRIYLAQRSSLAELRRQTRVLEQQNAELTRHVNELRDPTYLERVARECLGMVRPGEIGFIAVPSGGRTTPPSC